MKRVLTIIIILLVVLSLLSCKYNPNSEDKPEGTYVQHELYDPLYDKMTCEYNGRTYYAKALGEYNITRYFTENRRVYTWDMFKTTEQNINVNCYVISRIDGYLETLVKQLDGIVYLAEDMPDNFIVVKSDYADILFANYSDAVSYIKTREKWAADLYYEKIVCEYNGTEYRAVASGYNINTFITAWELDYSYDDFKETDTTVNVKFYRKERKKDNPYETEIVVEEQTGTVYLSKDGSGQHILVYVSEKVNPEYTAKYDYLFEVYTDS